MREIKFRGKDIDSGLWAFGNYVKYNEDDGELIHCIVSQERCQVSAELVYTQVDPTTIGEFTGLKDNNGKEIYEGDIVSYIITNGGIASEKIPASVAHLVHYDNKHATFKIGYHLANYGTMKEVVDAGNLVVIGNKYDNPELLKQ